MRKIESQPDPAAPAAPLVVTESAWIAAYREATRRSKRTQPMPLFARPK